MFSGGKKVFGGAAKTSNATHNNDLFPAQLHAKQPLLCCSEHV
jgi:hypothetical protein